MKTGFKLVSNYIQALSRLISLPPVMERVIAGARKNEREELEKERERERERDRAREKREREKKRQRKPQRET